LGLNKHSTTLQMQKNQTTNAWPTPSLYRVAMEHEDTRFKALTLRKFPWSAGCHS
jgi:hypothetical protein